MSRPMTMMAASLMAGGLMMMLGVLGVVGVRTAAQAITPEQTPATYRLASAQVVSADGRPPVLKLAASGPIAFELLPADASGEPARPDRIVARLYGVAAGELAGADSLAPFSLAVGETSDEAIVTIGVGGLGPSQRLVLRTGARASELEAAIVTIP